MQTRDQAYAVKIFRQVKEEVRERHRDKRYVDAYGSMAHKLPVLIRSAGLAQALEFVEARGKPAHRDLLDHLAEVVLGTGNGRGRLREQSRETTDLREYMRLTHESLAALLWYKRFAQSVLDVKDASHERDDGEAEDAASDETTGQGGE